jgi:hypothetical protein
MKTRKTQSRAARAPLFSRSSIGSAVAMALIASSGAHAAETLVGPAPGFGGSATGGVTAAVPQNNSGAVNAQVTNATVGTTSTGSAMNPAPVTQVTNGNLIGASATGNIASNKLGETGPVIPLGSAAALGVSVNTGTITSKVQNSATRVQSNTFQTGSVMNADNTISADTTVNSGTTLVTGKAVPGPVFSGTATLIFPVGGPVFDATGNVVVTSMQVAAGASSSATVQDNTFALQLTSGSNSAVTKAASASLERNDVSATFKANTANSTAEIQSGGAPSFAGSAVVSNLQANGNGILTAAHTALNQNSVVAATIQGVGAGVTNALQGTLTVKDNSISSAATGNEATGAAAGTAGNRILVGDASVAGTGATPANNSTHAGAGVATNVSSDLAIVNSQGNLGAGGASAVSALTTGAQVTAVVQSLAGGTVNLQDNSVTAAVTGNTASSGIATGTTAASFAGTAAESNQQANNQILLQAKVNPSVIGVLAGDGVGGGAAGVVTVSGNRSAATAQGNQITQTLAIQAGAVTTGSAPVVLTGGASADGRVSAAGAVTITNLQGNYDSTVAAYNGAPLLAPGSQILLIANTGAVPVSKSALSLTSNRQESVAVGSSAGNSLSLTGNSVGTGAGIASVQMGDANSFVSAALSNAQAQILVNGNVVTDSTVALADNIQRSVAYGNAVSNAVNVKANDVAAAPGAAVASKVTIDLANPRPFNNALATQPVVTAAYGVLNDQSLLANVSATTTGADSFGVAVSGNVSGGTVGNDRNVYVGAAYGNDAANGVKLEVNNLNSGGFASVANVTNTQAVGGGSTRIEAIAAGGTAVRTIVGGTLNNASVTSNGNSAETLAYGSRATGNTVAVKGTNINTAGAAASGADLSAAGVLTTNASFSVQNAQSGQGAVLAERGGPEVRTQIGGLTLLNSSVQANGNTGSASATSNSAVNGVSIDAVNVATTSAVQSAQITSADVTSRVGLGGQGGAQVAVAGLIVAGSKISVDGNQIQSAATGNEAASSIAVKGTTIASGSNLPFALAATGPTAANVTADHALSNAQVVAGPNVISARAESSFGIDTQPIALIAASQLSVSDNEQAAKAAGNTATNSLALAGTSTSARAALQSTQASFAQVRAQSNMQAFAPAAVAGGSTAISGNSNTAQARINDVSNTVSVAGDNAAGLAGPALLVQGALPGNTAALGDQLLVNRQTAANLVSSSAITTILNDDRTVPTLGLIGSSFDASGNKTASEATANRASNASTLTSGAQQTSRTGVLNTQDSSAAVTATATGTAILALSGPLAFTASQATLEGNVTSGAATGNSAVNSLEVKGNTVSANTAVPLAAAATLLPASAAATADHALLNVQVGTGVVSSTVNGTVGIDTTPNAVIGAAMLSVSGNQQSARAVGNTALNSVSLAGTNVAARGALQSVQTGGAAVAASSTSTLFAPVGSAGSTIDLSRNSNTALGVINDVTNTLGVNATNTGAAGASGTATLAEIGAPGNTAALGDYVLSSRQDASTSVSGTATTTLRNDDNTPGARALLNGSLGIAGNTTIAEASANRAVNTASVAGSAVQGASTGILNSQSSSAAATATASTLATVTLGGTATPLNAGSISLDGNTTAALARGNAATNTLDSAAGSGYGPAAATGAVSQVGTPFALNVGASAAILNSQTNTGAVTASSVGTSYQVALNSTTAVGVSGGSVGVTGNTLAAQAVGNSATNRITQTALNGAPPSAAIGSYQVNTGAVTATVTSVNFGVGVTGSAPNSALRATGNQITASATGNSSVSSIAAR